MSLRRTRPGPPAEKVGSALSANREHMSRIGRLGGKMSAGRRQVAKSDTNGSEGEGISTAELGQATREENAAPEADVDTPPASQSV